MKQLFLFFLLLFWVVDARAGVEIDWDSQKNVAMCKDNCYLEITHDGEIKVWCKYRKSEHDCKKILIIDLQKKLNKLPPQQNKCLNFEYRAKKRAYIY